MADFIVEGGVIQLRMTRWESLLSFHSGDVSARPADLTSVEAVPDPWASYRGWRAPGTGFPGFMIGTARGEGFKDFCVLQGRGPGVILGFSGGEFNRWLVSGVFDLSIFRTS